MGLRDLLASLLGDTPQEDGGLDWSLHTASLARWLSAPQHVREGWNTPALFQMSEQADRAARGYLAYHGLEDRLAEDPDAAFVAYSVAELLVHQTTHVWHHLRHSGALQGLTPEQVNIAHGLAMAAVYGACQRLTWHAAAHLTGAYDSEPFGEATPSEALALLDFDPDAEGETDD